MQRQVLEHINSEINKYISEAQSPLDGIILISRILKFLFTYVKDEAKDYSKQELYNYLKANFPALLPISQGGRQMLTDMLKEAIDRHHSKKGR
ncbi:MAG: hypothetical protein Q4A54_06675 [Parabacteroides sp.]|nr:hypothetical protein [Parabacteroides sp.]